MLAAQPAFDAASIKPAALDRAGGEGSRRSFVDFSPTRLTVRNAGLGFCIQWAYGVTEHQLAGPNSLDDARYDIDARTDRPVNKAELQRMLQTLLADRFKLALRRETRPVTAYVLVVDRKGAKLDATKSNPPAALRLVAGEFVFTHVSTADFAAKLSTLATVERPVIDQTGIEGVFDILLRGVAQEIRFGDGTVLFSALQDQLGLKLDSRKVPMEVLVVTHAERPSEN